MCRKKQLEEVDEIYIGESHISNVTMLRSHFELYNPGKEYPGGKKVEGGQGGEKDRLLDERAHAPVPAGSLL